MKVEGAETQYELTPVVEQVVTDSTSFVVDVPFARTIYTAFIAWYGDAYETGDYQAAIGRERIFT